MPAGDTFLDRTMQRWKFDLTVYLCLAGMVLVFLGPTLTLYFNPSKLIAVSARFGGMALMLGVLAWAAFAIRCPTCQSRLYLKARQEHGMTGFVDWINALTGCPVCGSDWSPGARPRRVWAAAPAYWSTRRVLLLLAALLSLAAFLRGVVWYADHSVAHQDHSEFLQ